jgi:hypothetical protein
LSKNIQSSLLLVLRDLELAEQAKEAIMSQVYDQVIKTRQANVEIQQALTEIAQMEKEIKDME